MSATATVTDNTKSSDSCQSSSERERLSKRLEKGQATDHACDEIESSPVNKNNPTTLSLDQSASPGSAGQLDLASGTPLLPNESTAAGVLGMPTPNGNLSSVLAQEGSTLVTDAQQQLQTDSSNNPNAVAFDNDVLQLGQLMQKMGPDLTAAESSSLTGNSGNSSPGASTDPIIASLQSSDPTLAQTLTDASAQVSQGNLSAAGFSQFESNVQTLQQGGQIPDDTSLLNAALQPQQGQQALSASDTAALQQVINSDATGANDNFVSTYTAAGDQNIQSMSNAGQGPDNGADPLAGQALINAFTSGQVSPAGYAQFEQDVTAAETGVDGYQTDQQLLAGTLQQFTQQGGSAGDTTALQNAITSAEGTTSTVTTGSGGPGASTDPIIASLQSSDPTLAQTLTDASAQVSQGNLSAAGFSQFESNVQTLQQGGQIPDDTSLLNAALQPQQGQQALSASDTAALQQVINSDATGANDNFVSTYTAAGDQNIQSMSNAGQGPDNGADPLAGQALINAFTSGQVSPAGYAQFEQDVTTAETGVDGYQTDQQLLAGTLQQFTQQGGSANDTTALQNAITSAEGTTSTVTTGDTNSGSGSTVTTGDTNSGSGSTATTGDASAGSGSITTADNVPVYMPPGVTQTLNSSWSSGGLSQFNNASYPWGSNALATDTAAGAYGDTSQANVNPSNGDLQLSLNPDGNGGEQEGLISQHTPQTDQVFTMVAKLPAYNPNNPADINPTFWMLDQTNRSDGKEVDVLEVPYTGGYGAPGPPTQGWIHDGAFPNGTSEGGWVQAKDANGNPIDLTNSYNSYQVVLNPDANTATFYIDGQQVNQTQDPFSASDQEWVTSSVMPNNWGSGSTASQVLPTLPPGGATMDISSISEYD